MTIPIKDRPYPPATLLDPENWTVHFMPGPEIAEWIRAVFLDEESRLFNEDHRHLQQAEIAVLWTVAPYRRQMHAVVGTAEIPTFRCAAWQKGRQEQQLNRMVREDPGLPDHAVRWIRERNN